MGKSAVGKVEEGKSGGRDDKAPWGVKGVAVSGLGRAFCGE